MSQPITLDMLQDGEIAEIREIQGENPGDPYVKMINNMGLQPGLRMRYVPYDNVQRVYIFDSPKGQFGLPIETCQRVFVQKV